MSRIFCCLIKMPFLMEHTLIALAHKERDKLNSAAFVSYIYFFVLYTFVLYSKDTLAWKWKAQLTRQDQPNNLLSWDNLLEHFQGKFILLSWCKMKLQIIENTQKRAENKPKSILEKPNSITNLPQRIPPNKTTKQVNNL